MPNSQSDQPPHETRSILLVDDNQGDYILAVQAFKKAEFNSIRWCNSGQEAIDFLQQSYDLQKNLPSIILLDLNMPRMDGHATLQRIKENEDFKNIPVIMMTSSIDERDVTKSYKMGANGHIQKPYNIDAFIEVAKSIKKYWFDTITLPINNRRSH